jgi:hypothetical protein
MHSNLVPGTTTLVAYDLARVREILRSWSPIQLRTELLAGHLGQPLSRIEHDQFLTLIGEWEQRALGEMMLRDALLVDEQRGRLIFGVLCRLFTREYLTLAYHSALPHGAFDPESTPALLQADPAAGELVQRAERAGLALALIGTSNEYPYPQDLADLRPPPPAAVKWSSVEFVPPRGWRGRIAVLLATAGVLWLIVPLLLGHIPEHPAGIPLALLTLALLVGAHAGWAGYSGALCVWIVANLPGFRHDLAPAGLCSALPLFVLGVVLLSFDRQIRALWVWVRRQVSGQARQ